MNTIRSLLSMLLLCFSAALCRHQTFVDINSDKVKLLSCEQMRFCYISFVEVDGKVFLVKQKNGFRKILGCVRDAITAYIAESLGIAHRVAIIPAHKKFPGQVIDEWPATVHTVAPGKMIKKLKNKLKKMNIKQADIGFRRDMLQWMAKHPTLVKVVALDTFLCNHDRHRGNLFYDETNDSYCAIDMDSSFKYNLCALAVNNFKQMMDDGSLFPLSGAEFQALIDYKKTLQFLINKHYPEDTIQKFNNFISQAGFVDGSPLYTERIHEELEANRQMIRQSYKDALELIELLEKIIKRATRSV